MPAARVERWFLRVMLGVSVVAWLALLLAELGQFRLGLLALLLTIGAFGLSLLVYAFRASPATPTAAAGWRTPALAATAGILLCAALFLPPYETAVKGGDATVYLNFGRQIAHHGALEFEDALLRPLSIASRAELFLNRVPLDTTGQFARFPGGFLIADIADPTVTAGFSPLFPVLTALGHAVGSPRAALVVAPLFATLSLVGLWCVARRLGGVHAAWLAATLTAVSLPQIWFAKLSVPETVAQCFVMAGVLAWLVACARGATRWALAAGWFLGLACFAKVDLLVLLPVFLLAVVAARLLTRARLGDPPLLLALLAAFGLVVAHNFVHYLSFATHYRPYVAYLIQTSSVLTLLRDSALVQAGAALTAVLLAAAGVAALRQPARRWPRWCWGWAAVAALVAYGVTAGFSPLFSVLTALGHALGSPRVALVVAPLFATLSLIGLWCVARRLGGVHAAWLAATLTAVSLPQIWFAKLSVPETVAQCFVMAGVLAWLVACARGAARWALAAGWFFGLACFAKVDLLVLLPVFLLAVVAARLLTRARLGETPLLLAFLAAFGLLVAHNLVHYLSFDSHYRPAVAYLIQTSVVVSLLRESVLVQAGVALAVGLLAAAGVAALRRPAWRWPRWYWGWAAVAALVAYGVNYVTTMPGRLDETVIWLSWYVSWPVLGLAALGLTGLVRVRRADAAPGLAVVGPAPGCRWPAVSVRPVGDGPADRNDAAVRAGRPSAHDALRRPNRRHPAGACGGRPISVWAWTLATGALLVGLVARPSLAVVGQPLWDEALAQTAQVARLFPDQAVVLVSPDLASHAHPDLTSLPP